MRTTGLLLVIVALLAVLGQILTADEDQVTHAPDDRAVAESDTTERKARLAQMRRLAERVRVDTLTEEDSTKSQLVADPLFRYSDELRGILDATLWCWQIEARPVALLKIERYEKLPHDKPWLYCIASLSSGLITAKWNSGQEFSSKAPGLEFRALSEAVMPADSKAARLTQLRQLARRFSATILRDPAENRRDEMRLLPQPLFRYANPDVGLIDAALFGFTATGTNPDVLLAVEMRGNDDVSWHYGIARMTMEGLSVQLDGATVWTAAFTSGARGPFDTWHWFHADGEMP